MTERLHFHFSLSCIGEGNGNPPQCSCLENPRDGGAWWAAVYGVAQSRTRLKRLSSSSSRRAASLQAGAKEVPLPRAVVLPRLKHLGSAPVFCVDPCNPGTQPEGAAATGGKFFSYQRRRSKMATQEHQHLLAPASVTSHRPKPDI